MNYKIGYIIDLEVHEPSEDEKEGIQMQLGVHETYAQAANSGVGILSNYNCALAFTVKKVYIKGGYDV